MSPHYHAHMRTEELDYDLPEERIATAPVEPRDAARLMVVRRQAAAGGAAGPAEISHHQVRDLPGLGVLTQGDLIVVNRTRVLPALFEGTRTGTGGRVRGLYLAAAAPGQWQVMLETRGSLRVGETLDLADSVQLTLLEPLGRGRWRVALDAAAAALEPAAVLERVGRPPLPPYIRKARRRHQQAEVTADDARRYNTVYADDAGSVAAPTAGLHFTSELLAALEAQGVRRAEVTLDVGLGTFEPIRSETLETHPMHRERLRVPVATLKAIRETRALGGKIVPIGTTTVRALESLPQTLPEADHTGETDLFIHPDAGFVFRFADGLMTNFHLPRSTLLAMIASLPGLDLNEVKRCYTVAIAEGYRFYSYGDAMLVV